MHASIIRVVLVVALATVASSAQSIPDTRVDRASIDRASLVAEAAPTQPPAATGLLSLPVTTDPGSQKAGRLLEQMVQALGGPTYLNVEDMQQQGRTFSFYHGEPAGVGAPFWRFWKWPDKERVELTKQRDWILIENGDNGYEITFRGTTTQEAEQLQDYLRRRHYSLEWVLRRWLKEPNVALFYEGLATAERKQAEQVSIMNAQNEALTIWIDTTTHLPLKKSFTWRDPKTRDRTEEGEGYDNYRLVQGIMTPFSVTRYKDGEPANQRFITDVKYNQHLADSLFDASVQPKPPAKKK